MKHMVGGGPAYQSEGTRGCADNLPYLFLDFLVQPLAYFLKFYLAAVQPKYLILFDIIGVGSGRVFTIGVYNSV